MKIIYVNCGVKNYMHEERFAEVKGRIPYKTEVFQAFFSQLQKLRIYMTAMVFIHIILHSAVHIYDFHIFKSTSTSFHGFSQLAC